MITKLNLSNEPFRNRKLPYLLAGLMTLLALFGLMFAVSKYRSVKVETAAGDLVTKELETELAELRKKGEAVQQSLTPAQQQLMVSSHKLVANKEFGWSRLLLDIERVLPRDVSASRIGVDNVFKEGNAVSAQLEFSVISRNYTSVLSMIERMNNSGIFRASLRGQDLQEEDDLQYSEYTLLLTYRPSAGFSANPPADAPPQTKIGGDIADAR